MEENGEQLSHVISEQTELLKFGSMVEYADVEPGTSEQQHLFMIGGFIGYLWPMLSTFSIACQPKNLTWFKSQHSDLTNLAQLINISNQMTFFFFRFKDHIKSVFDIQPLTCLVQEALKWVNVLYFISKNLIITASYFRRSVWLWNWCRHAKSTANGKWLFIFETRGTGTNLKNQTEWIRMCTLYIKMVAINKAKFSSVKRVM